MCPDCVRALDRGATWAKDPADRSYTNPAVLRSQPARMVTRSDDLVAIRASSVRGIDHAVLCLFACGFIPRKLGEVAIPVRRRWRLQ
jgi:hypothetical protein